MSFYSFVLILLISLFTFNFDPIEYVYSSTSNRTLPGIIFGFGNYIGISGFYFAVIYLRKMIKNLSKGNIFIHDNTKFLKRSGIFATISSLVLFALSFSEKFIFLEEKNNQDTSQFFLITFTLVTGLSFIVISRILAESTKIKEENELTI